MTYSLTGSAAEFYESTFVPALFGPWADRLARVVSAGDRVLDVACGTGAVARAAAGRGADVTGVDINPAMLAVARRSRPDLDWRTAAAESLPFPDRGFDWALSQAALMFFTDRVAALREMGRVGRRVVVQVPGRLSHSAGYRALVDSVPDERSREVLSGYFAVGSPSLLRELFSSAGLRIERFDTWLGATRLPSLETFLDAELLPIADAVDPVLRARAAAAMAPFTDPGGAVAAPIEAHLITAVRVRSDP